MANSSKATEWDTLWHNYIMSLRQLDGARDKLAAMTGPETPVGGEARRRARKGVRLISAKVSYAVMCMTEFDRANGFPDNSSLYKSY